MNNAIEVLFSTREELQRLKIERNRLEYELNKEIRGLRALNEHLEAVNKKYFDTLMEYGLTLLHE
jgi:predicted  nucleic acid-binding Zn-ribbon protein